MFEDGIEERCGSTTLDGCYTFVASLACMSSIFLKEKYYMDFGRKYRFLFIFKTLFILHNYHYRSI